MSLEDATKILEQTAEEKCEKDIAGFFMELFPEDGIDNTVPDCLSCGRHKDSHTPKLPPSGTGKTKVLIIGKVPTEKADNLEKHVSGNTERILRTALDTARVSLEDCWITSTIICHSHKKETAASYKYCRPNLMNTIDDLKPNVVVTLGIEAFTAVVCDLWKKDIGTAERWVGRQIPILDKGFFLCPTYHPDFLLRMKEDTILMRLFDSHIKGAVELAKKPEKIESYWSLEEWKSRVKVLRKKERVIDALKKLNMKTGVVAFDYETTGLKPDSKKQEIYSCSFSWQGDRTFAFLMDDDIKPYVSAVLKNKYLYKVAANLKFEERWTMAKLGHKVQRWYWDTQQAAHILDNRPKISSLKFQSFIQFGIPDYDSHIESYLKAKHPNELNKIKECNVDELLMYNGLDSLLEYRLMLRQKEIFQERGIE